MDVKLQAAKLADTAEDSEDSMPLLKAMQLSSKASGASAELEQQQQQQQPAPAKHEGAHAAQTTEPAAAATGITGDQPHPSADGEQQQQHQQLLQHDEQHAGEHQHNQEHENQQAGRERHPPSAGKAAALPCDRRLRALSEKKKPDAYDPSKIREQPQYQASSRRSRGSHQQQQHSEEDERLQEQGSGQHEDAGDVAAAGQLPKRPQRQASLTRQPSLRASTRAGQAAASGGKKRARGKQAHQEGEEDGDDEEEEHDWEGERGKLDEEHVNGAAADMEEDDEQHKAEGDEQGQQKGADSGRRQQKRQHSQELKEQPSVEQPPAKRARASGGRQQRKSAPAGVTGLSHDHPGGGGPGNGQGQEEGDAPGAAAAAAAPGSGRKLRPQRAAACRSESPGAQQQQQQQKQQAVRPQQQQQQAQAPGLAPVDVESLPLEQRPIAAAYNALAGPVEQLKRAYMHVRKARDVQLPTIKAALAALEEGAGPDAPEVLKQQPFGQQLETFLKMLNLMHGFKALDVDGTDEVLLRLVERWDVNKGQGKEASQPQPVQQQQQQPQKQQASAPSKQQQQQTTTAIKVEKHQQQQKQQPPTKTEKHPHPEAKKRLGSEGPASIHSPPPPPPAAAAAASNAPLPAAPAAAPSTPAGPAAGPAASGAEAGEQLLTAFQRGYQELVPLHPLGDAARDAAVMRLAAHLLPPCALPPLDAAHAVERALFELHGGDAGGEGYRRHLDLLCAALGGMPPGGGPPVGADGRAVSQEEHERFGDATRWYLLDGVVGVEQFVRKTQPQPAAGAGGGCKEWQQGGA